MMSVATLGAPAVKRGKFDAAAARKMMENTAVARRAMAAARNADRAKMRGLASTLVAEWEEDLQLAIRGNEPRIVVTYRLPRETRKHLECLIVHRLAAIEMATRGFDVDTFERGDCDEGYRIGLELEHKVPITKLMQLRKHPKMAYLLLPDE